jgi:hypothetical protein
MKIRGELIDHEHNDKKIKRIERPSQKRRCHRVRLAGSRKSRDSAITPLINQ